MIKAKSAKEKGNRFEKYLLEVIREQLDADAHRVAGSGSGLDKNDIRLPKFNIEIEAKNKSQITLTQDFEQLERQITQPNTGALIIRNPKKPEFQQSYVVMELSDWIELVVNQQNTEVIKKFAPEHKWLIDNTINNLRKCKKLFCE